MFLKTYLNYNRPLAEGTVNGTPSVLNLPKRIRKQISVQFPLCCLDDFNPNELITTGLGNGQVLEAEYSLSSKKLLVELAYE